MAGDGTPGGREDGREISSALLEALAGLDRDALQLVTEVIVLHREFPAWAVWLSDLGHPWIAVRPASARVPGPDLPMLWVRAATAAGLAERMRSMDAQLDRP